MVYTLHEYIKTKRNCVSLKKKKQNQTTTQKIGASQHFIHVDGGTVDSELPNCKNFFSIMSN